MSRRPPLPPFTRASAQDKVRLAAGKAWNEGNHDLAIQTLAEGAMAEPENLEIPAMLG